MAGSILRKLEKCVILIFHYFCCSKFESSPLAVWEAMSCAKPVVSFDVGDVSMYIKDNKSGFIVNNQSYDIFYERLNYLICNEEIRQSIGREAQKIAFNNFSAQKIALRTEKFYKKVAYK